MDRSRTEKNRNGRSGSYNSVVQPEYDVVVDDAPKVFILPANPIDDEGDYADRDPPRSPRAQSRSTPSIGNSNIIPKIIPLTPGPAINRYLKPGRRKTRLDKRPAPHRPKEQHSCRCSPSPPPLTLELESRLPGLSLHESCSKHKQRVTMKPRFNPRTKGLQSAESCSPPCDKQRHSLDLETRDTEIRSQQSSEWVPSKPPRELSQTADNFDTQLCVPIPMENPQQTFCEVDWYVGACNRVDAEHALHLVNKDGAFLVRDCSAKASSEPLVLVVYHDRKVYNLKIRFVKRTKKYTLGTRQRSDDMFDSVEDIIKFHSFSPIMLIRSAENCVLTCPVASGDVDQLLQ